MPKARIIPTLLMDDSTIVKGENFESWRSVGSTQAAARLFSTRDVDELMLLDVNATRKGRKISLATVEEFAETLRIPFSVGGGISSVDDARNCFKAGAEKVVIGSALFTQPDFVYKLAEEFGTQSIVAALDVLHDKPFQVAILSGTVPVRVELGKILADFDEIGVGEILLQSIKHDGKMSGMDLNLIRRVCGLTNLPVIASSGAGSEEDFLEAIKCGASAVAAGAIFQFTQVTPKIVRNYLSGHGITVRKA